MPAESPLNPNALDPAALAAILTRAGAPRWPVSEGQIRQDIDAGAPVNSDGTLNLLWYCAWLIAERGRGK